MIFNVITQLYSSAHGASARRAGLTMEAEMATISMNPGRTTYTMISEFKHDHTMAVLRGVLAAFGIVAIGVFTMVMPTLHPASDNARSVAAERSDSEQMP